MAVPVLEELSTDAYASGASSINVDYDTFTSINVGEILIIFAAADGFASSNVFDDSTNKPTGYTLINFVGQGPSAVHCAAWWKAATGSESGTIAVPSSESKNLRAVIARISGANTTSPIHVVGADYDVNNLTEHPITGHTTTVADTLALFTFAYDSGLNFTVASPWSEDGDYGASGNAPGFGVGSQDMATAGSTGDAVLTVPSSNGIAGFTFSIAPAAGAGFQTAWAKNSTVVIQ